MQTVQTKRTSGKPVSRHFRWLAKLPGPKGAIRVVLTYARRSDVFRYFVERIASDFGVAFQFEKIEPDGTMGGIYQVCVENEQDASCTCPGHTYGGSCKHLSVARAIIATENLN
jgi:hypothetical protein